FLSHCDSLSADLDHNVASLLLDTVTAALGAGGKTLQRLTLVDVNRRDAEFIDIGTVVMLGVGNSRLKCFLENAGCLLGRECQDIHGLSNRLAADEIRYKARFLGRDPDTTDICCSFHSYLRDFLSAA